MVNVIILWKHTSKNILLLLFQISGLKHLWEVRSKWRMCLFPNKFDPSSLDLLGAPINNYLNLEQSPFFQLFKPLPFKWKQTFALLLLSSSWMDCTVQLPNILLISFSKTVAFPEQSRHFVLFHSTLTMPRKHNPVLRIEAQICCSITQWPKHLY